MTDKKKLAFVIIPLAAAVLAIFAFFYARQQQEQQNPITAAAFKLNTVVTITIYDSQDTSILDGAMALCDEYEQIFSRTMEASYTSSMQVRSPGRTALLSCRSLCQT